MSRSKLSTTYIGNGAYCYANSTAMLLSIIGENILPSRIEVLSGVGLGTFLQKNTNLIFFSNLAGLPDAGINNALDILGFNYQVKISPKTEPAPLEELKRDLENSPAVVGPIDMGYLSYDPDHQNHAGIDHYVLAYNMDDQKIKLHDPAGFPCVALPLDQLKPAWKAERVSYCHRFYRYWTMPSRLKNPTQEDIYNLAIQSFKSIYHKSANQATKEKWAIGREAILICANRIKNEKASQEELNQLSYFALSLGARRALDFASFFGFSDPILSSLKQRQAELFGECHTLAVAKNWADLIDILKQLAEIEEEFRVALLKK